MQPVSWIDHHAAHTPARDLIAWCRAHLAAYKVPVHVVTVDELPRNATGKVLKAPLRAEAQHVCSAWSPGTNFTRKPGAHHAPTTVPVAIGTSQRARSSRERELSAFLARSCGPSFCRTCAAQRNK